MWRKAEENKVKSSPGAPPGALSSVQNPGPVGAPNSANTPAAVSHGIKIKGEISGQGDFFLDGEFEGKIDLPGGTFTVGPNARVHAEIEARAVIVRGEVIGALKSCERVHILSTGRLTGNMETRGIVIEDGAVLHSKVAVPQATAVEAAAHETAAPQVSASEEQGLASPGNVEPSARAKGATAA